ncbi:hypothetical protein TIFTF001_024374 [Ficus carica]|uniref:Uncharacterized protein n=1 Tax=Ficus carica TaxID=3494 RepID=A0AA88AN87_FICCA|nr:hypothetical protein TIFTF001_024374 [Ficus carica]
MYPRRKKQVVGEMKKKTITFYACERKVNGQTSQCFLPFMGQGTKKATSESSFIRGEARTLACATKLRVGRDKHSQKTQGVERALMRLFGTPLFIEPLSDEEALIAELALDTMSVEFPNPKDLLAKKKAQKKAAKATRS